MELVLAGDAMLGRGVDAQLRARGPAGALTALGPLVTGADAVFANLECAVASPAARYRGPRKAFLFRAGEHALAALRELGVGLVSLANNHALDAGPEGLLQTLEHLRTVGILAVGAGEDLAAAGAPVELEAGGARLAVLAVCDHQPDFAAAPGRPGIRYLELRRPGAEAPLLHALRAVAARVDHGVVSLHWQPNWVPRVRKATRSLAAALLEAGAHVVWGHSPHHLQGVEWFGDRVALYGTGSLIDDYAVDADYRNDRQLIYRLELADGGVRRVRAHPIELRYARTEPARGAARAWIVRHFRSACKELGSVVRDDGAWLEVVPAAPGA